MKLPTLALSLLLLLTSPRISHAQRPGFEVPEWAEGRIFSISNTADMTRYLNDIPEVTRFTKIITAYVTHVDDNIVQRLRDQAIPDPRDPLHVCSFDKRGWFRSVGSVFGIRGWPDPDVSCVTDFAGDVVARDVQPPYSVDQIYEATLARGAAIQAQIRAVAASLGDVLAANFTDPAIVYNFPYRTVSQQCVLNQASLIRVGKRWSVQNVITNLPIDMQLPLLERQMVAEISHLDETGNLVPLTMRLPMYPKEPDAERPLPIDENSTTMLALQRGQANPSGFITIFPKDNPAIKQSLEKGALRIQQVEDALTPSGIAILVLPLGLNLVPIALMADVSSLTMLLYTLASDILTVIPLGIKGVELISIGNTRERTIVIRSTASANGIQSDSAAADFWAAECRAHDNVRPIGILFLVLSIVALVSGVVAEVVSREYVKRKRTRLLAQIVEGESFPTTKHASGANTPSVAHSDSLTRGALHFGLEKISYDTANEMEKDV